MGYRDDFYVAANVLGYSGDLTDFPTVYFLSSAEHGHITQKHGYSQNVGRGVVSDNKGYTIENKVFQGAMRLLEKRNGGIFHASRSTLKYLNTLSESDKSVLYQAIWQYPEEKRINTFVKKDHTLIAKVEGLHANVMNQLVQRIPGSGSTGPSGGSVPV